MCCQRYSHVIRNGHTLILGWTPKTPFLLAELLEHDTKCIVILDETDPDIIRERIEVHIKRKKLSNVDLVVRQGDPKESADIARVSVTSATQIYVIGAPHRHNNNTSVSQLQKIRTDAHCTVLVLFDLSHVHFFPDISPRTHAHTYKC